MFNPFSFHTVYTFLSNFLSFNPPKGGVLTLVKRGHQANVPSVPSLASHKEPLRATEIHSEPLFNAPVVPTGLYLKDFSEEEFFERTKNVALRFA